MEITKDFKVVLVGIKEVLPYENNPRVNDGAVRYVKNSILNFGFKRPIIVDEEKIILAGHTRLKALLELREERVWETRQGFEWLKEGNVPVVIREGLTEAQKRAFRIADNRASELTLFDFEKVDLELKDLMGTGIEMTDFGFEPVKATVVDADQATVEEELEDETVICPRCGKVVK